MCKWWGVGTAAWTPGERGVIYAALGTGLLQFVPFLLACATWLSPAALRWAALGLTVLLGRDLAAIGRALGTWARQLDLRALPAGWKVWGSLLVAMLLLLAVHALGPGRFADDDGYHLTAPKRWLEAGTLIYLPSYGHTNSPMGFEMLYAFALSVGDVSTSKFVHFGSGCLTLVAMALCGKRMGGWVIGLYAITLVILPIRLYDFTFPFNQAYIELGTCLMVVVCVLLLTLWHEHNDDRALWLSALCAGFASSFKFPALFIGFGLMLAVVSTMRGRREPLAKLLRFSLGVGVLATLPVLPWLGRNAILTGNPVYPMFSGLIPSRDWNPELSHRFGNYFRYYNWAQNSFRGFGEETRKVLLVVAAIVLVAIAVFIYRRASTPLSRALVVFTVVPLIAWLPVVGLYFRFWLPMLPIVWLQLAAFAAHYVASRRWVAWPPVAGLAVWLVIWLRALAQDTSGFVADLRMGFGLTQPVQEFASDELWQAFRFLNQETPKSANVLFAAFSTTFGPTSAGGSYWVDRACFATDATLQGYIRSSAWPEFVADVRKARIDYVLVSAKEPTMDFSVGLRTGSANEWVYARKLVEQHGRELGRFGDAQVYRLSFD